jgi:hypothetical protein
VLIGYCSGAQFALEVALELKIRDVCVINPTVGASVVESVDRLKKSDQELIQSLVRHVETLLKRYQWVDKVLRQISRLVLSSAYPAKVRSALAKNQSDVLLLLSPEDASPFGQIPVLGAIFRRRLVSSERLRVQIVPGLDHAFLSTLGRSRVVAILDQHVIDTYASALVQPDTHPTEVIDS